MAPRSAAGAVALDPTGATRRVENEDTAQALVRFEGGVTGQPDGQPGALGPEEPPVVRGVRHRGRAVGRSRGGRDERDAALPRGEAADRKRLPPTLLVGPAHPHYARFSPAPGHGLGFNDLKVIEVAQACSTAWPEGRRPWPDFRGSLRDRSILAAIERSAESGAWVTSGPRARSVGCVGATSPPRRRAPARSVSQSRRRESRTSRSVRPHATNSGVLEARSLP